MKQSHKKVMMSDNVKSSVDRCDRWKLMDEEQGGPCFH